MENLRLNKRGRKVARYLDRKTCQVKLENLAELEQSYNQDLDRYVFMVGCLLLGQVCGSLGLFGAGFAFSLMACVSFWRAVFKVNDNLLWAQKSIRQEYDTLQQGLKFKTLWLIENDRFQLEYASYQGSNKKLTRVKRKGLFFWCAKNDKNKKYSQKKGEMLN